MRALLLTTAIPLTYGRPHFMAKASIIITILHTAALAWGLGLTLMPFRCAVSCGCYASSLTQNNILSKSLSTANEYNKV